MLCLEINKDTIFGIRDLDKHLARYVNDKDVLNMIVNKKYLELFDEQFFHNLLILKYPVLIRYKKKETWKTFYIKMTYYLSKLKKEFNFPYIPHKYYNPIQLYRDAKEVPERIWNTGLLFAAGFRDAKLIEDMLSKGARPHYGLMGASVINDIKLAEYFISLGIDDLASGLVRAAEYGHKDLVDYFIAKGVQPKYAIVGAATSKNDDIFNYIVSKYPVNLNHALLRADPYSIKYIISKGATNLNQALISFGRRGALRCVKLLVEAGATNIEVARDDAMIHGKTNIVEYLDSVLN
jgi:hypothetical protein